MVRKGVGLLLHSVEDKSTMGTSTKGCNLGDKDDLLPFCSDVGAVCDEEILKPSLWVSVCH